MKDTRKFGNSNNLIASQLTKKEGEQKLGRKGELRFIVVTTSSLLLLFLSLCLVVATPVGPTVTFVRNDTLSIVGNWTQNGTGGYIYWNNFNVVEQNRRWKAFVGNVSGTLTLDDASSNTIYNWPLGTTAGEVYSTINDSAVNWTGLNCTWAMTGGEGTPVETNRTVEEQENSRLSQTRLDNISSTFYMRNHTQFSVGDAVIPAHSCYAIHTFVNDTTQNNSGNLYFHEILLYDNHNITN